MDKNYITVTQLTKYIKYKLESDNNLKTIYLKGEISNFKNHTRGHLYFSLKDEESKINAIMFESNASKLNFTLEDGMKVLCECKIGLYEATGSYQVYINNIIIDGLGNLYLAFNQLKERLSKEGLFDHKYKKPIPKMPNKIGIITAPTGAAIKDILSTIKRRFPFVETILFPALVQGENAKYDIVKKIELANTYSLDVIILGRGGGSIEDLWPFNEEIVARSIFSSQIPIISGVGHEIDFTISDFVADLRAPTPTAAAELAVPNYLDIIELINNYQTRNINSIKNIINMNYEKLNNLKNSYILKNPMSLYETKEQNFDNLYERLILAIKTNINTNNERLNKIKKSYIFTNPNMLFIDKIYNYNDLIKKLKININKIIDNNTNNYINILNKLEVLNPVTTLKRGYSIVKKDNKTINTIKNINIGEELNIKLSDGTINTKVINKVEE